MQPRTGTSDVSHAFPTRSILCHSVTHQQCLESCIYLVNICTNRHFEQYLVAMICLDPVAELSASQGQTGAKKAPWTDRM